MTREKYWAKDLLRCTKKQQFNLLTKYENYVYNIYKNTTSFLVKKSMVKKYEIMYYKYIRKLTVNSFEN